MNTSNLANAVFGNLFLIAFLVIAGYVAYTFKELQDKNKEIKLKLKKLLILF